MTNASREHAWASPAFAAPGAAWVGAPLGCDVTSLLQAEMEAAELWRARTKKAITKFEKDVVSTISTPEGSVIASEMLLRYMEEKNRQRVSASWETRHSPAAAWPSSWFQTVLAVPLARPVTLGCG